MDEDKKPKSIISLAAVPLQRGGTYIVTIPHNVDQTAIIDLIREVSKVLVTRDIKLIFIREDIRIERLTVWQAVSRLVKSFF